MRCITKTGRRSFAENDGDKWIEENGNTTSYVNDAKGNVISSTDGVGTLTIDYAYDAVSNRTSRTVTIEGDVSHSGSLAVR